jgi:hypothetical protein
MYASRTPLLGTKLPSPRRLKTEAEHLQRHHHPELRYLAALNQVAKARGWSSYTAYERAWHAQRTVGREYVVTLSARWFDCTTNARGSIHAHARLTEPWANFLPLAERRRIGTLGRFHILHADRSRLVAPEASASWRSCAHTVSKATRQLVFLDVMRVLPASQAKAVAAFRGDPHRMLTGRYPSCDHDSLWCDPATGLYFILNEPYQIDHGAQDPVLESREMEAFTTRDWTIHNPEGTLAQLIAPVQDKELFTALVNRSQALPTRFSQITFNDDEGQQLDIFR